MNEFHPTDDHRDEAAAYPAGDRGPAAQDPGTQEPDAYDPGAMDSGTRIRLTVCVIAKNEARFLPGCLESVRDWADEIVVVDTGSTDNTMDVARRMGARVFSEEWRSDFSLARNAAISRATGDWILSLDADERLDYINGSRLRRVLGEAAPDRDAFQLRIVSAADRIDSGVELVHFYPRVFRRHPAIRYKGALHEQVMRGDTAVGPLAPRVPVNIYHIGYADPEKNQLRLRRNHTIALDEAGRMPEEPTALMNLADTCVMVGEFKRAEELYLRVQTGRDLGALGANVAWNLAVCRFKAGETDRALADLDQTITKYPEMLGTRFLKAQLLMELRRHAEALPEIEALLDVDPAANPRTADIRPNLAYLMTLKGVCLVVEGRLGEAEQVFDAALSRDPQLFAVHAQRADLLMTQGRPQEALAGYLRSAALRPDNGTVRMRAGLILLDMGRRDDGRALIAEAGRLDPTCSLQSQVLLNALLKEQAGLAWRDALAEASRSAGIPMGNGLPGVATPAGGPVLAESVAAGGVQPGSVQSESVPTEAVLSATVPPETVSSESESAEPVSLAPPAAESAAAAPPTAAPAGPAVVETSEVDLFGNPVPIKGRGTTPAATRPAAEPVTPEPEGPVRLTVCLIVRNEAERLPGCLDSVEGVADEIVVCDTGSTDDTVALARARGARVVDFPWCDDFAAARNAALAAAHGEWILVLDADERLAPRSAGRLPRLLDAADIDGYNVSIESMLQDDMISRFVGNYCRLFRRRPEVRFEGRVHEQIYPSLRRMGGRVIPSELVIEHLGYALDPGTMARKKRRNLALLELEFAERPQDHFVQFNLGVAWFSMHDLERAEPFFRSAIRQTGETLPSEVLQLAFARLAQCALGRGDLEQAARDARGALGIDPQAAIPRFVLASIAYRHERYLEAAAEFRRLLDGEAATLGDGLDRSSVERELGVCLYRGGRYAEAAAAFHNVSLVRAEDPLVYLFLGNARARNLELGAAVSAYRAALALDPGLTEARGNLELVAVELGYRLHDEGRYAEAADLVPEETENSELLFLGAVCRYALQEYPAARNLLARLNAINDTFAEAWWNLALTCRALGDLAGARDALARFRHLAPGDDRADRLEAVLAESTAG